MPEDPFNPILDQLGELLKLIETSAKKPLDGPVDPAIEKQLAFLEEAVNRFDQIADEEIAREGKDTSGMYAKLEKTPQMYSDFEKKLLRRCRDLGVNAFVLRMGLKIASLPPPHSKKREVGKNTQKTMQKRKNKFKGVDGGSKWKRL